MYVHVRCNNAASELPMSSPMSKPQESETKGTCCLKVFVVLAFCDKGKSARFRLLATSRPSLQVWQRLLLATKKYITHKVGIIT